MTWEANFESAHFTEIASVSLLAEFLTFLIYNTISSKNRDDLFSILSCIHIIYSCLIAATSAVGIVLKTQVGLKNSLVLLLTLMGWVQHFLLSDDIGYRFDA